MIVCNVLGTSAHVFLIVMTINIKLLMTKIKSKHCKSNYYMSY